MLGSMLLPLGGLMIKLVLDGKLLSAIVPGLIALFIVLAVFVIRREMEKPRVCLDADFIKGYTSADKALNVLWNEAVSIRRPGATEIHVHAAGQGPALVIPVNIAISLEFLAAVEKLAPAEHPLCKWQVDETTGHNPAPYTPSRIPVILGVVGGVGTMLALSLLGGKWFYIPPQELMFSAMVVFGVVMVTTLVNKQVQGKSWSNQHWLDKITSGVMNFAYGSFMSVIAFDMFLILAHLK